MLPTISRSALRSASKSNTRAFSSVARRMAEGDAGSARSGGAAQSDAFTKREKASEDLYVRQQESEKLAALKRKIADGESQLAKDREEAEKLGKQ